MALTSGIFNSVGGDRKYNAEFFASYFSSFIGNGVYPNPSTGLQVTTGTNMQTRVRSGKAFINGYFLVNDSDYTLTHDVANGSLNRIDRVVMRLNYLTRQIEIVIKKGTNASSPSAPTLQRDTSYYELALADVRINKGVTSITQSNITDRRSNTSLCGYVKGVIDQIDTTNLFAQFDTAFNEWFDNAKNQLSGDVAGNLLTLINDKADKTLATVNNNGLMSMVQAQLLNNLVDYANETRDYRPSVESRNFRLTLINGIKEYSTVHRPIYRKTGKYVEVMGAVSNVSSHGQVIATLPTGYRPPRPIWENEDMSERNNMARYARWSIGTDGKITMQATSDGTLNATFWYFHFFYNIEPTTIQS